MTLHIVDLWQYYVCCTRSGVQHLDLPDAPSVRCSTCAVCAGGGYTWCCDRTLVNLCDSTPQNLAVPPDFYSLSVSLWNDLGDHVFCGVGLAGFKSRVYAFLSA